MEPKDVESPVVLRAFKIHRSVGRGDGNDTTPSPSDLPKSQPRGVHKTRVRVNEITFQPPSPTANQLQGPISESSDSPAVVPISSSEQQVAIPSISVTCDDHNPVSSCASSGRPSTHAPAPHSPSQSTSSSNHGSSSSNANIKNNNHDSPPSSSFQADDSGNPTHDVMHTLDTTLISSEEFKFGIEVINLHHSYGDEKVLQGLTMKVEHGSIYGLLGASGCGKTTLLKCIIGMMIPSGGYIDVFGRKPRAPDSGIPGKLVGYMPQDVALYNDLTIEETMIYFGRLYFMERERLMSQIDYLLKILDLPNRNRIISTLSGGQMRRVSFAAALVHEPPLVILDEPTAGVDPILRKSIWTYLERIVHTSKITVIITTHYIEEAKSADRVGLMRAGRLLAEDDPKVLMQRFGLKTLEDVFLALCTKDERHKDFRSRLGVQETVLAGDENNNAFSGGSNKVNGHNVHFENEAFSVDEGDETGKPSSNYFDHNLIIHQDVTRRKLSEQRRKHFAQMQRMNSFRPESRWERFKKWANWWWSIFSTLMWKNWIRSIRHPLLIVFQYILPAVQIVLFGICIGGDPFDIKVGIVNDELPPNLSELFLYSLDPYFVQPIEFHSTKDAEHAVSRNEIWGYLHIRSNFSDSFTARLEAHDKGVDPDDWTIAASNIKVYADLTDKLIAITMERTLQESYYEFAKKALEEFEVSPELATIPIEPAEPVYGVYKHREHKGYREYMAPGILMSIAFSMAYAVTCVVLILEREEKTFERNFVTGITSSQIIIAHTLIRMFFMMGQGLLLLMLSIHLFSLPVQGPVLAALLLLMTQNLCGIAYGMLLSAIFRKTHYAAIVAIGTIFFIFFISGVLWPVEAIGLWLRWFSYIMPATVPNDVLRSILSRGIGFTDWYYWKGVFIGVGWTVVLFFVSIYNYTYTS